MTHVWSDLTLWRPHDDEQEALRREFVEHTRQHAEPANRSCRPDHLTASALVASPDGARVLLGLHRKVGLWLQFGGHVEHEDHSLAEAAMREAREESGITALTLHGRWPVQVDRHPAPCAADARHHLDVQYLAVTSALSIPVVSDESLDVQWFEVGDLPVDTDDAVRRLCLLASMQLALEPMTGRHASVGEPGGLTSG